MATSIIYQFCLCVAFSVLASGTIPCPDQHYPIELVSTSSWKTIVTSGDCGKNVSYLDLATPPNVNIKNIPQNSTYSLFLLKNNDYHDDNFTIMWQLGHIKPNGTVPTFSLTTNPLHVVFEYTPPSNIAANYTILVYKENITLNDLSRLPNNDKYHFNPPTWEQKFHGHEMQRITHNNFIVGAPLEQGHPGYPTQPGSHPGYPTQPGSHPGYPTQPGSHPGYPAQPGSHPGYPAQPDSHPGYPAQPDSHPGYPTQQGSHPSPPMYHPQHTTQPDHPAAVSKPNNSSAAQHLSSLPVLAVALLCLSKAFL